MSDLTVTPGKQTSEFKLAVVAQVLGVFGAVVPPVWTALSDIAQAYPQVRVLAAAVSVFSVLWTILAALGYAKQRTALKIAALKAPLALALVLGALLAAAPARADGFLVHCFSGCPDRKLKLEGLGDNPITATVWAGPGVGLLPFVYNGATHVWNTPVQPMLSYGIWWRPPGWTQSKSLLGANFAVSGELGTDFSHLDPILNVVLFDAITVGGGTRVNFASGNQRLAAMPLFAIGYQTSVGGP